MSVLFQKVCEVCATPLSQHEQFSGTICSHWQCRWKLAESKLKDYREQAAKSVGETSPESYPIAVIPFRFPTIVQITAMERQAQVEHVRMVLSMVYTNGADRVSNNHQLIDKEDHLLAASFSKDQSEEELPSEHEVATETILGKVCQLCEGYCCYHGAKNNGFVNEDTLTVFIERHPDYTQKEVLSAFCEAIPNEHYSHSCLYHTNTGCALPRHMRSKTCNTYECNGIRDSRVEINKSGHHRVFAVARQNDVINSGVFVDMTGFRVYTKK